VYPEGTVVGGKYRIEHVLGEGGMGIVVAARHLDLGSRVALKFLTAEMARHPSIVERFMREARASAALQSENVCRVIDVGRVEETGIPYIVMEMLTGEDLARTLKTRGPLPATTVAEFILQASQAIAEAHALGIVHRDLKPGNLFLSQRPNGKPLIKVLDFGVAKAPTASQDFSLTRTHNVMGSPGYMSPEQLKSSKVVDARADIWSIGVVMYELISGRQPFIAESITELAVRVVTEPHPPLPATLPRGFVEIVGRCLEKDPARRYPDIAALAAALAPFAAGGQDSALGVSHSLRGTSESPPRPVATASASTPTTLGSASGVSDITPQPRRGVLAGIVGAAAAIGVIIVFLAMRKGDGEGGTRGATVPAPPAPQVTTSPAVDPPPTPTDRPAGAPVPRDSPTPVEPKQPPPETTPVEPKQPPPETTPVEPKQAPPPTPVEAKQPPPPKSVDAKRPPPPKIRPVDAKPLPETKATADLKKKPATKKPSVEDLSDMRK
jgi:serine/threonine-protein kinase